jgi:hypothetical protein
MPQLKFLVASPSYRGIMRSKASDSLLACTGALRDRGVAITSMPIDLGDIATVRNLYASLALQDETISHVLFYDDDMECPAHAGIRLQSVDKPVVGYIYPKRQIDLQRFYKAAAEKWPFAVAMSKAMDFLVGFPSGNEALNFENGVADVPWLATGLMLIKRDAFSQLASTGKVRSGTFDAGYSQRLGLRGKYFEFFEQMRTPDGVLLSEDISFCHRWRELCGGEVWAIGNEPIGHIGNYTYRAAFLDQFKK